ncbi:MAG: hypothetical protein P1V81_10540 [Planctomycetota bacterium]|nr:hypothetical protein [Planctomycetota bacterium]
MSKLILRLAALAAFLPACASPPSTALIGSAALLPDDDPVVEAPAAEEVDHTRDFDFWLGEWECFGRDGTLNGTNSVALEADGRVVQEHWVGAGGGSGTSLSALLNSTGRWHQTWIDSSGGILRLDGGLDEAGRMILESTTPRLDGKGEVQNRVVWTPGGTGDAVTVHQLWTWSIDGGATWNTAADLIYRRP